MSAMASQITSLTSVYSTVCLGADQRKHQSSTTLAFVRGIHRWPVNSPHKGPVTRRMFPFDDVIMLSHCCAVCNTVKYWSVFYRDAVVLTLLVLTLPIDKYVTWNLTHLSYDQNIGGHADNNFSRHKICSMNYPVSNICLAWKWGQILTQFFAIRMAEQGWFD